MKSLRMGAAGVCALESGAIPPTPMQGAHSPDDLENVGSLVISNLFSCFKSRNVAFAAQQDSWKTHQKIV